PFASLNHFTCPCAIPSDLSSGVFSPCVRPRESRGYLPVLAGKLQNKKTPRDFWSARRVSRSRQSYRLRVEPEPRQELHEAGNLSTEFWRGGVRCHSNSISLVNGPGHRA